MKERWFNYRPICLTFLFLMLGTIFSFNLSAHKALCLTIAMAFVVLLLVLSIYKKKLKYFIIPLLAFLLGIFCYNMAIVNFNNSMINYTPTTIECRVSAINKTENGRAVMQVDSCKFDNKKNNSNALLYVYDYNNLFENIEVGSVLELEPNAFYQTDLFYYDLPDSNKFEDNIKYTITASVSKINYIRTDKTISDIVKEKAVKNLSLALTNENLELATSALFGEKELLSASQYEIYRASGVAHLLAVSGLHVGIIISILYWVLGKFKLSGIAKILILIPILIFYAYLCNFSVSIIRASIMTIILLLANALGREYDTYNALSIAGILCFLINPLCVFSVGFLLSFSCAFGIAVLNVPIKRLLLKTKMNKSLVSAISISLACSISIIFITAFYFKSINIISVLTNILLIPLFSLAFSLVFVAVILAFICPYIVYVLQPINYIFSFINIIAIFFGNLYVSNLITIGFNYMVLLIYFALLLFIGRLCSAKREFKVIITLPMVALLVWCLI